ncbi:AAA family ATPase [Serratia nevei]|uniref:AAA family ATPase n=1 Tax=Serratia TaxID=613 RepID=UPI00132F6E7B|nr:MULTISPECIES: AAA family ATPase [Serratia]MBL0872574.1 AAA family ATPase [Serratia nevei]MBN5424925.1 AAA family ATPase [Serratia marcescens]MDI3150498.1 AAA family ATPase [Serratia nevei]
MYNDEEKFNALLESIHSGNVYFVTGRNGSGKSRFFAYATKSFFQYRVEKNINRIVCMSGTMHDKYPPEIYKKSLSDESVIYLGNKVNNNMVSDTAPFRILCKHILNKIITFSEAHSKSNVLIHNALQRLNFDESITFKFRYGKNRKKEVLSSVSPELKVNLITPTNDLTLVRNYLHHIECGDILLSDISFFRNDFSFGLAELSSGEKQYAISLLGAIYCGCSNSMIYYDEPENSLHPSWQLSIINDLANITKELFTKSILIIATHSPLIASSVRNDRSYICDFPAGQSWQRSYLHGQASDVVLREQFHLYSARSPEIYIIINKCLDAIARNKTNTTEFEKIKNELRDYNLELQNDDPLYEVVTTILGF